MNGTDPEAERSPTEAALRLARDEGGPVFRELWEAQGASGGSLPSRIIRRGVGRPEPKAGIAIFRNELGKKLEK